MTATAITDATTPENRKREKFGDIAAYQVAGERDGNRRGTA
jgi:hypothetical protein